MDSIFLETRKTYRAKMLSSYLKDHNLGEIPSEDLPYFKQLFDQNVKCLKEVITSSEKIDNVLILLGLEFKEKHFEIEHNNTLYKVSIKNLAGSRPTPTPIPTPTPTPTPTPSPSPAPSPSPSFEEPNKRKYNQITYHKF